MWLFLKKYTILTKRGNMLSGDDCFNWPNLAKKKNLGYLSGMLKLCQKLMPDTWRPASVSHTFVFWYVPTVGVNGLGLFNTSTQWSIIIGIGLRQDWALWNSPRCWSNYLFTFLSLPNSPHWWEEFKQIVRKSVVLLQSNKHKQRLQSLTYCHTKPLTCANSVSCYLDITGQNTKLQEVRTSDLDTYMKHLNHY